MLVCTFWGFNRIREIYTLHRNFQPGVHHYLSRSFFSILAHIIGAIAALLYNVFESRIGGIEIELVNK